MLFLSIPEQIIIFSLPFLVLGVIRSSKRLHLDRTDRILPSARGAVLFCIIATSPFLLAIVFARPFIAGHLWEMVELFLCLLLYCGLPYILGNLIRREKPNLEQRSIAKTKECAAAE